MTKLIMTRTGGSIYFDCINHAGDESVCTIISTLCNVLVSGCLAKGKGIKEYKSGHVHIDVESADDELQFLFERVYAVILELQEQEPDHVKVY